MAKTMKAVDAVMVGMGWSGSIMARELTKAGLTVVGLERGADRLPHEDFALPRIRDELKYRLRLELMLDTAVETDSLRQHPVELALPMRRWGAFPPLGDGVGGAGAALERRSHGASARAISCCGAHLTRAMAAMRSRKT